MTDLGFYNPPDAARTAAALGFRRTVAFQSAEALRQAFLGGTVAAALDRADTAYAGCSHSPADSLFTVAVCMRALDLSSGFNGLRVGASPEDRDVAAALVARSAAADVKLVPQSTYPQLCSCLDVYITSVPEPSAFLAGLAFRFFLADLPGGAAQYPAQAVMNAYNLAPVASHAVPRMVFRRK